MNLLTLIGLLINLSALLITLINLAFMIYFKAQKAPFEKTDWEILGDEEFFKLNSEDEKFEEKRELKLTANRIIAISAMALSVIGFMITTVGLAL